MASYGDSNTVGTDSTVLERVTVTRPRLAPRLGASLDLFKGAY